MNYRSVVIFGKAVAVTDDEEKEKALDHIVEILAPGQLDTIRPMTRNEMKGTLVLRLPLDEASAKVRAGGPKDEPEDYQLPIWAGVLPIAASYGEPITDPDLTQELPIPDHIRTFDRKAPTHG